MDRRQFIARAGIASVAAAAPVVAASQPLDRQAQIEHHIAELRRLLAVEAPDPDFYCIIRPEPYGWDAQSAKSSMDTRTARWV